MPSSHGERRTDSSSADLAQRILEREERFRRAHEVAADAVTVPASERLAWVESHPDCLCCEFAELMIAISRERRGEEPHDSVRYAHLAVCAAEASVRILGDFDDDVRALAWAELGNAHRICGDLRLAGIAFHQARSRAKQASDPLVQVEVDSLEASYRDYRREFALAEKLLRRARRIATRVGGTELTARIDVQLAEIARRTERYTEAIEIISAALSDLDVRSCPRLAIIGIHNLSYCLLELGALDPGLSLLRRFQPAYLAFADPRLRTRRDWLEAKALAQRGELEESESLLLQVLEMFAALRCPYEVAIVHLDLAEICIVQSRWMDVERITSALLDICRTIGADTESIAAVQLLGETAARRQITVKAMLDVATVVRRHLAPRAEL